MEDKDNWVVGITNRNCYDCYYTNGIITDCVIDRAEVDAWLVDNWDTAGRCLRKGAKDCPGWKLSWKIVGS
jgi:hypothetical protein